jgi:hypothetical protein
VRARPFPAHGHRSSATEKRKRLREILAAFARLVRAAGSIEILQRAADSREKHFDG